MCKNEITIKQMFDITRKVMVTTESGRVIKPNVIKDDFQLEILALVYDVTNPNVRADLLRKGLYYKSVEDIYTTKLRIDAIKQKDKPPSKAMILA